MQRMGRRAAWKLPSITADGLKIFACITMFIQSIGIAVIEKGIINLDNYTQAELSQAMADDSSLMVAAGTGSVMQLIGGLSVPIFAYLLVEGFRHTSDFRKYMLSMFVFALVSEIPYDLANSQKLVDWSSQNSLVTMCICLLMVYFLDLFKEKKGIAVTLLRGTIVLCAVIWVTVLMAAYGLCMVLLTAVFYLFYSRNVLKTVLGMAASLLYVTGPLSFYGIWFYNEQRKDRLPKYVYYVFYPAHLLVLGVISCYLQAL